MNTAATGGVALVALDAVVILAFALRARRKRRRSPGGPEDGKGCLTTAEKAEFTAITSGINGGTTS